VIVQSHSSKAFTEENAEKLAKSSTKTNEVLFRRFLASLASRTVHATKFQTTSRCGESRRNLCCDCARTTRKKKKCRQAHGPGLHPPHSPDMPPPPVISSGIRKLIQLWQRSLQQVSKILPKSMNVLHVTLRSSFQHRQKVGLLRKVQLIWVYYKDTSCITCKW
jgi:hypothetical protein